MVLAFTGLFGSQCAVLGKKHRVLTTELDEKLTPDSPVLQAALSPIAVPVGVASLLVDGLIINPIRYLPDSVDFANHTFKSVPFAGVGEIIVFPMRVITWPILFIGAEIVQTAFPF